MSNRHNTLFYLDIFLLSYFMMLSDKENEFFTKEVHSDGARLKQKTQFV